MSEKAEKNKGHEVITEIKKLLGFGDSTSPTVTQIFECAMEDIRDERKKIEALEEAKEILYKQAHNRNTELEKTKALLSKLEEEDERLQEELLCAKSKIDSLCAIGKKQAEHLDIQLGIIEAQAEALKGWSNDQK